MNSHLPDGRRLLLASSSPFRRELLTRLQLPFQIVAPNSDETPYPGETGDVLVARLAASKAQSVALQQTRALIIGSDQVAVFKDKILGKPDNHANAIEQLRRFSSQSVTFYTGLCLWDSDSGRRQIHVAPFVVHFRHLTQQQIEAYLHREQPYQCAGSFKSEGLGIALFEKLTGEDPTSLVGLPLIQLIRMLEAEGIDVIQDA
jgi:septum formation protein